MEQKLLKWLKVKPYCFFFKVLTQQVLTIQPVSFRYSGAVKVILAHFTEPLFLTMVAAAQQQRLGSLCVRINARCSGKGASPSHTDVALIFAEPSAQELHYLFGNRNLTR